MNHESPTANHRSLHATRTSHSRGNVIIIFDRRTTAWARGSSPGTKKSAQHDSGGIAGRTGKSCYLFAGWWRRDESIIRRTCTALTPRAAQETHSAAQETHIPKIENNHANRIRETLQPTRSGPIAREVRLPIAIAPNGRQFPIRHLNLVQRAFRNWRASCHRHPRHAVRCPGHRQQSLCR